MGRSRHRAAVPSGVSGAVMAVLLTGVLALALVVTASGALLRVGLAVVALLGIASALLALQSGRRATSMARAELSRERAARSRDVESLQVRLTAVESRAHVLSARADADRVRISSLSAALTQARRPTEQIRPTLLLPLLTEAVRRSAPVPLARVRVRIDDQEAVAAALAPRAASVDPVEDDLIDEPIELAQHDDAQADAPPQEIVLPERPEVIVVGEFSLVGLAAFARPAGMPDPGVPLVAPATAESIIDLRADERSTRGA